MTFRVGASSNTVDGPVARVGVVRIGMGLALLAGFTAPWNGVRLGGVAFGDGFLILAAMALFSADVRRPLPHLAPWVLAYVGTVLIVGAANQFFPPSQAYLTERNQLFQNYIVVHAASPPSVNLAVMVPLAVRLVLLSSVFGMARSHDSRALYGIAWAFVLGTVVCSLIAFTDSQGLTSLGPSITGVPASGDRASGLTQSPNGVAFDCVFSLPFTVWLAQARQGRARVVALAALISVLVGLYASGSRAGAGAAAVAGLISLACLPGYRRHLTTIGFALALAGATVFVARPTLGSQLLRALRITGGSTSGSDQARSIVNQQGIQDFFHSPFYGVGFSVAEQAHIVYLQALAVGGLVLLTGLLIYLGGALVRSARAGVNSPFAIALFASILGGIIFDAAQNGLTPTFVYVMAALASTVPLERRPTSLRQPIRAQSMS